MANIKYTSDKLVNTYSTLRTKWDEFYKSELDALESIKPIKSNLTHLDVGCGCGGLSNLFSTTYGVKSTGIDINNQVIEKAKKIFPNNTFYEGDILSPKFIKLHRKFDIVTSFSCVDWNIESDLMFKKCWSFVKEDGWFIVTLKLTDMISVKDIKKSFQYLNHITKDEKAQYTIYSFDEIYKKISNLNVSEINHFGYWLPIKKNNTVAPYDELCFSAFAIKKTSNKIKPKVKIEINYG